MRSCHALHQVDALGATMEHFAITCPGGDGAAWDVTIDALTVPMPAPAIEACASRKSRPRHLRMRTAGG